jgi:lauroyl/myristoyl acyltransferase
LDLQEAFKGRFGIGLAYSLTRLIPASAGEKLTHWIGSVLARQKSQEMVKAVRANQWVVSGCTSTREELDQRIVETFANNALSIFRFYKYFRDPEAIRKLVIYPERLFEIIRTCREEKCGLIIAGVHTGNFDLVLHSTTLQAKDEQIQALAISAPEPGKGYKWQNRLRERRGLEIIPASMDAIKLAAQRLEQGGVVVTGLDRPIPDGKYRPLFFNIPASLPVLHVPLALRTGARIVVVGSERHPDGRYQILVSDSFRLQTYPLRRDEMLLNAQAVLQIAEDFIRKDPSQWTMTYPVWPEMLAQVP